MSEPPRQLFAPFPYFGGKRHAAEEIWDRLGNVPNYVAPCCGSLAAELLRPHPPGTETLNDADGMLINFWRAVSIDPEAVAHWADWPVSELDLTARHGYLVQRIPWLVDRLEGDPLFCDPMLAGWWVWGACSWIGSGWCSGEGPWIPSGGELVHRSEAGLRQLPHLGTAGAGINRQLPHLGDAGAGINRKLPHLGDAGRGINRRLTAVTEWLSAIQGRLRSARFTCGSWDRVLTPVVTHRHGITGILLDPPYLTGSMEYAGGGAIARDVERWCRENGAHPLLRIALCGHDGDYDLPGWDVWRWKARGGYGNAGGADEDDNRHREAIWFSPHCLGAKQASLWA